MSIAGLNFTSGDYLSNSAKRIDYLRKVVNGRPVAILASGPSIEELENRINELEHLDICYFGFNTFIHEKCVLQQIGKHLSVFVHGTREGMPELMEETKCFLNRDEDNMFVSAFYNNPFELMGDEFDLKQFLKIFDRKLLFVSVGIERIFPNRDCPLHFICGNSLMEMIQLAVIGKAPRIVIFGADGGQKEDTEKIYYRNCNTYYGLATQREHLVFDTNHYFNPLMPIAIRNTYKTYNLPPIDIINCSENSFNTSFPVVTYNSAFDYLLTDKKFNVELDLRVPKVSVISPFVNADTFLIETIESVTGQSCTNHEHIIVYGSEVDDEVKGLMKRFPYVRWVFLKDCSYLEALRKGFSMARGDYISYCRVGDLYASKDWLNTCVGTLENYPDISLVWGLGQYISYDGFAGRIENDRFFEDPPPQGKEFIYYWLKEKTLYPEGNICVRKSVFKECFPVDNKDVIDVQEAWVSFNYSFHSCGYIPYFVPVIANYSRGYFDIDWYRRFKIARESNKLYYEPLVVSSDAEILKSMDGKSWGTIINTYRNNINQFKRLLITRKVVHQYKNGAAKVISGRFDPYRYFTYNFKKIIKKKLPNKFVSFVRNILRYGEKYHWNIIKRGVVCFLHFLQKSV
ncbi:MAG: glycosyltransferase [Candidatus Scalindua sp.]|nr:glycosyltransferase [Candidatus Scalindua sp.]MBT5307339.1 glycosyltransferase [Candidatus Scalindua sp.]MBT6050535.1 glycosyltransferase [Candidatus Scalindua sp.]MBT6230176.1 glycosyltransferase [Candidatus Scalindua sp.]MBT6563187.1 glycosyltransferase [Candidatus Scalindua sp.]